MGAGSARGFALARVYARCPRSREWISSRLKGCSKPISVAVMGCVVNGPGEASDADVGVACGRGVGMVFRHGEVFGKVHEDQIVEALLEEIDML